MEAVQNSTTTKTESGENSDKAKLSPMHIHGDSYIAFCAVQGLITDEDGNIVRMTAQEFADKIGVSRSALYQWQNVIPNFWVKVNEMRKDLGGRNRIAKIYNGLYLKAAAGNPQAAALYLANNDPNFRMPTQKVEHDATDNYAALLAAAAKAKIIDGEVVEQQSIDPGTSTSDQPPHPQTS